MKLRFEVNFTYENIDQVPPFMKTDTMRYSIMMKQGDVEKLTRQTHFVGDKYDHPEEQRAGTNTYFDFNQTLDVT